MTTLHIDEVIKRIPSSPIVVNFQNGYPTESFGTKECMLLEHTEKPNKTVLTEVDNLLYAGEELKEDLRKTLILVRNKKSGKVRLIEVGVAELKPILKIKNINSEKSQLVENSNLELSRKFGSKKQKQQMEHREKLKVNVETVTEQMQEVTENITEDKLDLSGYNKNDSDDFYIPPINRNAETVQDVYDINEILTEEQFDKISSELEGKDFTSDLQPWIKNLVESNTKMPMKHKILAIYASSLLKMYITTVKEITKKSFTACSHSATLNEIILSNFTSVLNGRRTRSTPLKDKALCHAIVFILLINNYKFEVEAFCQGIKLTATTASLKIRVTGATVVNTGSKKIVQLKLPLNTKSGFRRRSAKF